VIIVAKTRCLSRTSSGSFRWTLVQGCRGCQRFDAGIQAESFHPDCIIVDFSIGRTEALQILSNLRRNSEFGRRDFDRLLPDDELDELRPFEHQRRRSEAVRRGSLGRASADADCVRRKSSCSFRERLRKCFCDA